MTCRRRIITRRGIIPAGKCRIQRAKFKTQSSKCFSLCVLLFALVHRHSFFVRNERNNEIYEILRHTPFVDFVVSYSIFTTKVTKNHEGFYFAQRSLRTQRFCFWILFVLCALCEKFSFFHHGDTARSEHEVVLTRNTQTFAKNAKFEALSCISRYFSRFALKIIVIESINYV